LERSTHFVHGRDPRHVDHVRLELVQTLLIMMALAEIVNDADEPASRRCHRLADGQIDRKNGAVPVLRPHFAADADDLPIAGS
jgi:hypothetical protein